MTPEYQQALNDRVAAILASSHSASFWEIQNTLASLTQALAKPLEWCVTRLGIEVTNCCPREGITLLGSLTTFGSLTLIPRRCP
jgi:hypothetical protein